MAVVRKLTDEGIVRFSEYLRAVTEGSNLAPLIDLLADPATSEELRGHAEVEHVALPTKQIAADYLRQQLAGLDRSEVDHNVGLWTWLSLFYFDQVCPAGVNGTRKPGEIVRHVLSKHAHKYYRHLLAGPYRLVALHGANARIFLHLPLQKHGDFSEQLASRMELVTNCSLIEAVDRLYFDPAADESGAPKRGAATRSKPGNLRRLVAVIQQLDLTYDLYAMTCEEILKLLPGEFDGWRAHAARVS